MTAHVVSGDRHANAESRPVTTRRALTGLVVMALAAIALVLPPLGSTTAWAAAPAVTISLTQSSPDSRINAPITFTATVALRDNGAEDPGFAWYVEFRGSGDGGWSSGPVAVDDGQATYSRTSAIVQTESVTVAVVTPGCGGAVSSPVTHRWWRPEIIIDQPDARTVVGQDSLFAPP